MSRLQDLTGKRFGRLVVLERAESVNGRTMWKCKCDCGVECVKESYSLKIGDTRSCGCLHKDIIKITSKKHGLSKHPLYKRYLKIKERCYNPNNKSYKDYGGRGIKMCDEWLNDFVAFYNWAMENGYEKGLEIDRIDNNKGYSPDNCRFVDRTIQANNRRTSHYLTLNGQTKTIANWSKEIHIDHSVIEQRVNKLGWSDEKALTTPVRRSC